LNSLGTQFACDEDIFLSTPFKFIFWSRIPLSPKAFFKVVLTPVDKTAESLKPNIDASPYQDIFYFPWFFIHFNSCIEKPISPIKFFTDLISQKHFGY
jgi:BarA-like signal transduction histidine kinase